ncbi:MAG: hypothetical protein AVDCRST_MAG38-1862, partial [uncultured Solirubrobacteraceae bacterium]
ARAAARHRRSLRRRRLPRLPGAGAGLRRDHGHPPGAHRPRARRARGPGGAPRRRRGPRHCERAGAAGRRAGARRV